MKIDVRYANHPDDSKHYTTEDLRRNYLIETIFVKDEIPLTYSHQDRMITGGAMPVDKELTLAAGEELKADYFLQRRELGLINVGGSGYVILDGKRYEMKYTDGLYVGMGTKEVVFGSLDKSKPAKFYFNSSPAHKTYPTVHIPYEKAVHAEAGNAKEMNKRTINKYLNPAVCETCQLQMGMTVLAEGSCWNTMPCHTHERRMEVYFYFNVPSNALVFHLMGQPNETRHIVMRNEQAVISPSWSIHAASATSDYVFIWGMCGENQTYTDMDNVPMSELK